MAQFIEIDIDQGSDFAMNLDLSNDDGTPKDATGYTFASSIKKSYYSVSEVAAFNVNVGDAQDGLIALIMDAETTAGIKPGRYLFDVKQIDINQKVERLVEGIVTINPQVTI